MASILNVEQIEGKNNVVSTSSNTTLDLSGSTTYVGVPGGTAAARGTTPSSPAIRFSDDANNIEVYDGNDWKYGKRYYDYDTVSKGGLLLNLDAANPDSIPRIGGTTGVLDKWYDATFNPYFARWNTIPSFIGNDTNPCYLNLSSSHWGRFQIPTGNAYFLPASAITQETIIRANGNSPFSTNATLTIASMQNGIGANKSINLSLNQGNGWSAGVNIAGTFDSISVPFTTQAFNTTEYYHFVHSYTSSAINLAFDADVTTGSAVMQNVTNLDNIYPGMEITGYGFPTDPATQTLATVQSIDYNNNTITLDITSTDTDVARNYVGTIPAGHYIYVNGNLVGRKTVASPGQIQYDLANNNYLTIGMAYEGAGNNAGPTNYFDNFLGCYRIYSGFFKLKDVEVNKNAMQDRYGFA